jgi:hypothetical protein
MIKERKKVGERSQYARNEFYMSQPVVEYPEILSVLAIPTL